MEEKNYTGLIPDNTDGKSIVSESRKECDSLSEAEGLYRSAKARLLDINNWDKTAGSLLAEFRLTDEKGTEKTGVPTAGDHFKISVKAPENDAGEGFDWVKVEAVKEVSDENIQSVAIRVRPSSSPLSDSKTVAHFYDEKSTSTFVVTRTKHVVTASVYDKNIDANHDGDGPINRLRNTLVGSGAKWFMSKLQWNNLCDGLLKGEASHT